MDPNSSPPPTDAETAPLSAVDALIFRHSPEFSGATGIVAGLRALASGKSTRETWLIARPAQTDMPQQILGRTIVARSVVEGFVAWRYCDAQGNPYGEDSCPLIPEHTSQALDFAVAFLSAHLFQLSHQLHASVFRLDPTAPAIVAAPALPFLRRTWRQIDKVKRNSTPVTAESLRDRLCHEHGLSPGGADQMLEAHAHSDGLLRIGDDWFTCEPSFLMAPVSYSDYERIVAALRRHDIDCASERLRHSRLGNHGAARALASEEAETKRTIERISAVTELA